MTVFDRKFLSFSSVQSFDSFFLRIKPMVAIEYKVVEAGKFSL